MFFKNHETEILEMKSSINKNKIQFTASPVDWIKLRTEYWLGEKVEVLAHSDED
jgi:hypothetical protein